MLKIAIIEDYEHDAVVLRDALNSYARRQNLTFDITVFKNAIVFLQQYHTGYDIVFMDIDMPGMNGLSAAKSLREIDSQLMIVFVTALARFAINGYEVNAFDFIIKPIQQQIFDQKMKRCMRALNRITSPKLLIRTAEQSISVYTNEIILVDISKHVLTFMMHSRTISSRGTMKELCEVLDPNTFAMCNKSCMVNLYYVERIEGDSVVMTNQEQRTISRPRKTTFMQQIASYYGNRKINVERS